MQLVHETRRAKVTRRRGGREKRGFRGQGGEGTEETKEGGRREWKTVRRREKETADDRGVLTFDSCVFLTPIPRSFLLPLPPESGIRRRFIADRRIFRSTGCGPVDFSVTVLLYNFRALSLIYFVSYICRF